MRTKFSTVNDDDQRHHHSGILNNSLFSHTNSNTHLLQKHSPNSKTLSISHLELKKQKNLHSTTLSISKKHPPTSKTHTYFHLEFKNRKSCTPQHYPFKKKKQKNLHSTTQTNIQNNLKYKLIVSFFFTVFTRCPVTMATNNIRCLNLILVSIIHRPVFLLLTLR